ncbi:uncharacterized protein A4U43_UnF3380 [Asparagus officinalis]|uniref:2-oxoadipate dioxygenase/decarboxylase n=1 Tax=Asparagus officinalis TaxID=4686 RepID=A0A1R3L784_ASPOF|nr:uncharacterized protein A4U43_UnF3380 [Asparagus officinalis]
MASQSQSLLRSAISSMEKAYLSRNPTIRSIIEAVSSADGGPVCYDHFTFRTLAIDGHGIDSVAKFFLDCGYTQRDELRFPAKKLKCFWFAPPETEYSNTISLPLPRVFIAELLVDELSSQSQEIIRKYVKMDANGNKYAVLASILGCLTWEKPTFADYQQLSR